MRRWERDVDWDAAGPRPVLALAIAVSLGFALGALAGCGGSGAATGSTSPSTPIGGGSGGGLPGGGGGVPGGGGGGAGGGSTSPGVPGGVPLIVAPPAGTATRFVAPTGDDAAPGTPAQPWRTLQHAVAHLVPGDILEVGDGTYAIATEVRIDRAGTSAQPIIIRSSTGGAVVDGAAMTGSFGSRDALYVDGADHVVIHGLTVRSAARSGARISLARHVTVQGCRFLDNGRWGIFTDYADDLALLGNECARSGLEHGIYFSNSGDRPVIRGNFCHDNHASGIQLNADPALPGDGITEGALVEGNVCARNGAGGGAAINCASVRGSVIRQNLLHDNLASGIALWDDGFDPAFGSKENVIAHNTVVFASGEGRYCVALKNGSTGNRFENNVFVGGRRGVYDFTSDSLPGIAAAGNVLASTDGWPLAVDDATGASYAIDAWRTLSGADLASQAGSPIFLAPGALDFALAPGSPGHDQAAPSGATPAADLYGIARPQGAAPDAGAFER